MNEPVNVIMKCEFGSHLYGTATPESDRDYKGIFIPTKEDIFLGKIPRTIHSDSNPTNIKNTSEDTDIEWFSLQYFIKLACEGQTVALDMLHVPERNLLQISPLWSEIVANRERFYTRNLTALVGYARRQAAKYSIRGSRLDTMYTCLALLQTRQDEERLSVIWDQLPINDYACFVETNSAGVKQYQICGRTLQETLRIKHAIPIIKNFTDTFGHRARLAQENKGIDWKAMSHALRAAFETQMILEENTIRFPLPQADFLRRVKLGELDFATVSAKLDQLMDENEELARNSDLPNKVNRHWWDKFVVGAINEFLFKELVVVSVTPKFTLYARKMEI